MSEVQPDLGNVIEDLDTMMESLKDMFLYTHNLQKSVAGANFKPVQKAIKKLHLRLAEVQELVLEVSEPGEECSHEVLQRIIEDTASLIRDVYADTGTLPQEIHITFEEDDTE